MKGCLLEKRSTYRTFFWKCLSSYCYLATWDHSIIKKFLFSSTMRALQIRFLPICLLGVGSKRFTLLQITNQWSKIFDFSMKQRISLSKIISSELDSLHWLRREKSGRHLPTDWLRAEDGPKCFSSREAAPSRSWYEDYQGKWENLPIGRREKSFASNISWKIELKRFFEVVCEKAFVENIKQKWRKNTGEGGSLIFCSKMENDDAHWREKTTNCS